MPKANSTPPIKAVSIRPDSRVLSVLRHLNYRAWFAISEFVDNSLQSYFANKAALNRAHRGQFQLKVSIEFDPGPPSRLSVRDNAAGIAESEYGRAFRPAAVPPDRSGLSEFGMGMKSAACWFAPRWRVRTLALGEDSTRTVEFDIESILSEHIEELAVKTEPAHATSSFTEIVLEELHQGLAGRTLGKVKEHLTDIYRVYLRDGTLQLRLGKDLLEYSPPNLLSAPDYRNKSGSSRRWSKEIDMQLGGGLRAHGFAALMDPAQTNRSGFALFRRNRLIQGSGDEGYRPVLIFGQAGNFRWRRLFGELHLEGFEVSHTKDGFQWDENEQPFIELLRDHLDSDDCPLLRQADNFRAREPRQERVAAATKAADRVSAIVAAKLPGALPHVADAAPVETRAKALVSEPLLVTRQIQIKFRDENWTIRIEMSDDPSQSEWLSVSDQDLGPAHSRVVEIRVNLAHAFMVNFAQTDPAQIEPILRLAAGLAVSEIIARQSGIKYASTVRRNLNDLLSEALASLEV